MCRKVEALLLLGPTGSGKSPLGDHLAAVGLRGRRCCHFDFGANLRRVQSGAPSSLTPREMDIVGSVLSTGRLLEASQFGIALKVLGDFLASDVREEDALVVLNGLPRHAQQAEGVSALVDVVGVIALQCDVETVIQRVALNVGGDRTDRKDDAEAMVRQKLATYHARTAPLIDYYRTKGVNVTLIDVSLHTQIENSIERIEQDFLT
ncbi:MAG: nucleoside monophosphate kinase [Kiritimatiellae bacterium]|nr:nucleoside monophosphate kinase [Kiritimatiellia bacterium]